jgi:hybrid cluster-associated redox disulfide protein
VDKSTASAKSNLNLTQHKGELKMTTTISKDMMISDILTMRQDAASILINFGMGCLGCPSSQMESLEQAAQIHGIDIQALISALNA